MIDRPALAHFLRGRREALQPEDVGLPRGQRRRTSGLLAASSASHSTPASPTSDQRDAIG